MRYESCVTSLSWIPSEAVTGLPRQAFDRGLTHYDDPPPDELHDIEGLRAADRFRFANVLSAWIEVDDDSGQITGADYTRSSRGLMGSTPIRLGWLHHRFQAFPLDDRQATRETGTGWVRFAQTTGGRTGLPAPRHVQGSPYARWHAPWVWTTLSLTLHVNGHPEPALAGASRFPRHWVYDNKGHLFQKSGLTDFTDWYRTPLDRNTPWGGEDSSALAVKAETSLERELSAQLMHGGPKPRIKRLAAGATLARQGQPGTDIYLVLDGIIRVELDGEPLAEYGPGALLGERAHLEAGIRTSTLVAVTPCRVAMVDASQLDQSHLEKLSRDHRREDASQN
jgi:Cyclic nucleotide-binding domain